MESLARVPEPPDPGEGALIARARDRDAAAFRRLVETHRDRAYGLALRMLRSPEEAEEVVQDAFVRAWIALPRFRGEARFSTWLYRIVARRSLDRIEGLAPRRARESPIESAPPPAVAGPDAAARARALRLERLMERLSPAQRAAVTLHYWEDAPVEKVAEMLGMPENTVKTHLARARAALREAWIAERTEGPDELRGL